MMNTALVMPVRLHNRMEGFLHSWGCFRFFLLALLLCSPAVVFSQQRWERNYGGTGDDRGYSVQQTRDGGYIVAGWTTSFGYRHQVYLIKTNAQGDTLWTRHYGGAEYDWGNAVQQTSDGGYIIAGFTDSFGDSGQVYLVKTNATGDTLWTRTYGWAGCDENGWSVQQTSDTGYIVAGTYDYYGVNPQVYLVKANATGDTLWTRTYGGAGWDEGRSVQQTTDGGYIVAGFTNSFGNGNQVYLIKTNASGDTLWTRTYGGAYYEEGHSVQKTSDGCYIVAGWANSFGNGYQVYLIKTNASGDTLWTKTHGGTFSDYGYSVQQTQDTGYVIAGNTWSFGNGDDVYLVKTDASGDTLWSRTYGGTNSDIGWGVQQTTDGGYIIAGETNSFGNGSQVYLIKTDTNGNAAVEDNPPARIQPLTSNLSFSVVPDPFTSFTTLPGHSSERFSLYDISGRKVGVYKGDRIGSGLSAGVYFLRPQEGDAKPVRVVKIR